MAVLRTDIERALDELESQEEGMRFQGLAVILGKKLWPELIARQRKKDSGLDAYAPSSLTPEKVGKGLAASITNDLKKISGDAKTAKENFPDLEMLLFVTSAKVGNAIRKHWENSIQDDYGLKLYIIEREEIITQMLMPENASLCASFLNLNIESEPQVKELIIRTRRAANVVTQAWAGKTKGHPLIDLTAVRLDPNGAESTDVLSLEQIDQTLSRGGRIVLEGPAGRGKTTTLIQLAQRTRSAGIPFIVDLPMWISTRQGILEYIAGMPSFQAEKLTVTELARVQQTEPFLLLLNGWNEITESNSAQANDTLRELERYFPGAGIIVATRTHHLTPPLPEALRLRLSPLRRAQRAAYLADRFGAKGAELRVRIDADPSLDELTRTAFVLSEVASLFEAGAEIPSTKIGILTEVLRLQEHREEHRNALQAAPIYDRQRDYLKALATEMTRRGAVALSEAEARTVAATIGQKLVESGQITPVGAPAVLATLTAHHVIERLDYPQTAFQFEHQQVQEYYAALDVRTRLYDLRDDDHDATDRFTSDYVNDPAWAEPLRMIAETFAEQTGVGEPDKQNTRAGGKLVEMALAVDPVFAGELVQLCGAEVLNNVRAAMGERLRGIYAIQDGSYRRYALAAMLATGADDFKDIIVPLLSGDDQQTRLRTYRLWPDFRLSSLGLNWREEVRGWSVNARADFVSELLHHRIEGEVAMFAAEDKSIKVKRAAVDSLMWTKSEDELTQVLESMDSQTFEEVARNNADRMPTALKPKTIAMMRKFIDTTDDHPARLRTALALIRLGETGLDGVVKDVMSVLSKDDLRNLFSHFIQPALEYLRETDPSWASEWVAIKIAEGAPYGHEYWLPFATAVPDGLVEKFLLRLETEDFNKIHFEGLVAVITTRADAKIAERVFAKLRELRRKVDAEPDQRHEFEWQVMRQLETVFHGLPGDVAAAGILTSVTSGDPLDIELAADLLTRVARPDVEPLSITNEDLKARLRAYLKNGIDLILRQDDFNGELKANLASAIAQVGRPEDISDLMTLIRADIQRMRRGRAARVARDHGPLGHGGYVSYAKWHIAAVTHLDPTGIGQVQVFIDLLSEPEYASDVAAAMARDFLPKQAHPVAPTFRYDLMWAAREKLVPPPTDDQRRTQFTAALNAEIRRLLDQPKNGKPVSGLDRLATALAAVDAHGSAAVVLDVIAMPGKEDPYARLAAAELLLMAGVVLPTSFAFALVDSVLKRTEEWMHNSDRYLLIRTLVICPFVDNPGAGIDKMREVLGKRQIHTHDKREIITALGNSRSDAAIDFINELGSDPQTFKHCEDSFINAFASLDTPRASELLLGFIDPDIHGIELTKHSRHQKKLVEGLTKLAQRRPKVAMRLLELCEHDLPEPNRHLLSKVMEGIGTSEALYANLNLIDDAKSPSIPQGIWDQLESTFIEHRPYEQIPNAYTLHARASNELRSRLFRMASEDKKRRMSASKLLGQIEEWRLEHGKPTGEPRHPDLASGQSWPPREL